MRSRRGYVEGSERGAERGDGGEEGNEGSRSIEGVEKKLRHTTRLFKAIVNL